MIRYIDSTENVRAEMLDGFFVGWANPPSKETLLKILRNSYAVVLAVDNSKEKVVGFVTAISDGLLCAHIALLEVLPEYHNKKIGTQLLSRMLAKLEKFYDVSLMCDENLQSFYARFGMSSGTAMNIRNYERQSGDQI
jgi:ribosomal protein S18 acetylase RimI-like enzyme